MISLSHCTNVCSKGLRETTENLNQDRRSSGQVSGSLEYSSISYYWPYRHLGHLTSFKLDGRNPIHSE
jgi:hypothetical protein